jgi:nucleoside-diphosphate-sugar epimerase
MSNVLITGGAGFIGSHLAIELLNRGYNVRILDTKHTTDLSPSLSEKIDNIDYYIGDVRNKRTVYGAMDSINIVFHLAAVVGVEQASKYPLKVMDTELQGISNVLEEAYSQHCSKVIYASSSETYGDSRLIPLAEDLPVAPLSSYGISKLAAERYCKAYHDEGLKTVSLRIFNAYGPGQDNRFVVSRFIEEAIKHGTITMYYDGIQTRDFTYIDDVIEAFILAATQNISGEVFNVGTGVETSIKQLAEHIAPYFDKIEIKTDNHPSGRKAEFEIMRRVAECIKCEKLGYKPKISLQEGLGKTINYIRKDN